jgi:hypothetical protein
MLQISICRVNIVGWLRHVDCISRRGGNHVFDAIVAHVARWSSAFATRFGFDALLEAGERCGCRDGGAVLGCGFAVDALPVEECWVDALQCE